MSTRAQPVTRRPAYRRSSAARKRSIRRRRIGAVLGAAIVASLAIALAWPGFHHAVREVALPLRHEDIIRQQALDKGLDPALIAAVIYAESRFRDGQRSAAGAVGLMQLTPQTAHDIARRSGATNFRVEDLDTPQVNIAYGSFYLRYLLDRYGGNLPFAIAAYNGGEGNVDKWIARARERNEALTVDAIPFAETRAYVRRVVDARSQYARSYPRQLGRAV